jgi:ABC-type glutathione transport system ATPase component
MAEDSKILDDP